MTGARPAPEATVASPPSRPVADRGTTASWVGIVFVFCLALGWWARPLVHPSGEPDLVLPDSIARAFDPVPPAIVSAAPTAGPPASRPVAAPAGPSARIRHDLRAMAEDLARTRRVAPSRAKYLAYVIVTEAYRQRVPPALVLGVMLVENDAFKSRARSSAGALGLMQIMPNLWRPVLGGRYGQDLTDDATNIRYGVHILATFLRESASWRQGLLRYNGCVRGTNTPDCFRYPDKVATRVERTARASCPSRRFDWCVVARLASPAR